MHYYGILSFVFLAFSVSTSSADDIFVSVKTDDVGAIVSAVENDPSVLESIGPGGQTPLINAVLMGKLNAVKTLLDLNADTSAAEKDGYNVLHAAGFQGRSEILEIILEQFAKQKEVGGIVLDPVTDKHQDGYYPMHRACWGREQRHADTVKVFLKYGVPRDLKSEKGMTCADMTRNELTLAALEMTEGYEL
eukprot:CAMPEP_0201123764 /NCGR_PEP_ID=MMETSP0850-20130426/9075_1 /ASSEMBLY_ACC=CAM_ASM_000622 /TAXON_ID=183588 /ORGANISM="Pseudo-nitzschia fraudulenta, Strain WWA7" /LENGTH=191 /DNA_ID=CAMNT_0047390833 /DNA_START=62 /DNA_END=637 /DNA_ORIENTATION=+